MELSSIKLSAFKTYKAKLSEEKKEKIKLTLLKYVISNSLKMVY